jgi:signal transduction histidine kinase
MRLQSSLFLAFAFSATLPLGVTAWVTRSLIRSEFADNYEQRLAGTERAVRVVYADLISDEQARLASLCDGDPLLDAALVQLARDQASPQLRAQLQAWASRQARALSFDSLDVIGQQGLLLASAHYPGRQGEQVPELATRARQAQDGALLAPVNRPTAQGDEQTLSLVTACQARQAGRELTLLGGRHADASLADRIASRLGVDDVVVFVLDENRTPQEAAAPAWDRAQGWRQVLLPLVNPGGATPAWLAIAADDTREKRAVRRLDRLTLMVVAVGIALSWLLGVIVARRIGHPLGRLADQARLVAEGTLEQPLKLRASGEVRELVEAFNRMTVDLRDSRDRLVQAERVAAWRDIARRIAHEIKNPLFPIQTSIETVRKAYGKQHPDFDEIFDEATVTILEEVERLKHIVTEFSRFARLPKPEPEPLDLHELVANVTSLYQGQHATIELTFADNLPTVNADRDQLTQVFHNLLKNALDATAGGQEGATIWVTARPTAGGVTVEVRDNGSGLSQKTKHRVFEPYFTTKEGRGTGLGLAIVHRIVTDHGGHISVQSRAGEGASFYLHFTTAGPAPAQTSKRDTPQHPQAPDMKEF